MDSLINALDVAKVYFQENIIYWYVLNFIIGTCFASCVGLIVARWPAKLKYKECLDYIEYCDDNGINQETEHYKKCQDIISKKPDGFWFPGSRCDVCNHDLKFWHNIPIFGWLSLRGKCGFCKTKIPFSVLLAEIIGGSLGVIISWLVGDVSLYTYFWMIICAYIAAASWLDWQTLYLPTRSLSVFTFLMFIIVGLNLKGSYLPTVQDSLYGAMIGFSSLLIINESYYLIRKIRGFGEGDYYLLGALGSMLGVEKIVDTILLSFFVGLILTIVVTIYNKIIDNKESEDLSQNKMTTVEGKAAMPFGPSISIAALVTVVLLKSGITLFSM